jgi:Tfp pilus assembly protein PilP
LPVAPGGAPGAAPAPSTPAAPRPPQEAFTYQADGRRDPFLNLLNGGVSVPRSATQRGEGVAGLAVNEIAVRGLAQMSGTMVALVQGPDGRNYNVHQGDKLADGSVKSITPEGLVIMQDVNDPLSTAKQREVRKLLRSVEEAKP